MAEKEKDLVLHGEQSSANELEARKKRIEEEQKELVRNMPHDEGVGAVPDYERDFNFAELALAEDELHRLRQERGEVKETWWQRLGDWYFDKKENREKHLVNRTTYLWLCWLTGLIGGHRFYEKRYGLGVVYLALSWTGLPIALSIVDWMIALPMKPDENGQILL